MSTNVVTSQNLVIYWGRNATWKSGTIATDKHQAFNPIVDTVGIKLPEQLYDLLHTSNSLNPTIEVDKHLDPSTITFRCYFRDPFILGTVFTYKGLPTSWTGTGDTITFNFSNNDNIDNDIWVQFQVRDQSGNHNHVSLFLDGGVIESYRWDVSEGGALIEEFDIKFAEITESYRVGDIDDGFDDGSFNQTGVAEVSTITAVAASSITNNTYFFIYLANAVGGNTKYHVWFNKDGAGVDPAPSGSTAIAVAVTTGQTASQIATAIGAALDDAADGFGTPVVVTALVTVTQANTGDITDVTDSNSGLTLATTTQGKDALDGGWSMWDGAYTANQTVLAKDITITAGIITGLQIMGCSIEIDVPKAMKHVMSSATAAILYSEKRKPSSFSIKGVLTGNQAIAQAILALSSKTKATAKLQYGTTKYMQITNAVLKTIDGLSAPASGESIEVTYNFEATATSVVSYSWTANEATDPSNMINHTNV